MIGLVDCNNFYVSCERLFKPWLKDKPVVVLSNNDGCIVSRSQEAKAVGVGMGKPFFEYEQLIQRNNVSVFSSNYVLYGDLSQRIMRILTQWADKVEEYSIDEAFIYFNDSKQMCWESLTQKIRQDIQQQVGLPVSIGISSTKTLAKIATHIAKNTQRQKGVFYLSDQQRDDHLKNISVKNIWGMKGRRSDFLKRHAIHTAYDLKKLPDQWIKKYLTIDGLRTVWELRGIACIPFEDMPPQRKGIMSSRSFKYDVLDLKELEEAVATYAARASEKLRRQKLIAGFLSVYLRTNKFKNTEDYKNSIGMY